MPYKDKNNPNNLEYLENRKETIKLKRQNDNEWRLKQNKSCKEWYYSNQERVKDYRKSEKGIKHRHLSHWKAYPIKLNCRFPTWDILYDYYLSHTHCELCDEEFYSIGRKNNKNMDHNHKTYQVRWVVCSKCNHKLGKTDKYFNILMNELKMIINFKSVFKILHLNK